MSCELSTQMYGWVRGRAVFSCVGVSLVAHIGWPALQGKPTVQLLYRVVSPVTALSAASRLRKAFGDRVTGAFILKDVVET